MRAVLLTAMLAGCSFPVVDRVVPEDAAVDSAIGDSSSADVEADSSVEDSADEDSSTVDSTVADSAKADSDSSVGDGAACPPGSIKPTDPCDCDGDGDRKPGGACGGTDCDDNDPRAHYAPPATFRTDKPPPTTGGDWNCNGKIEKQFSDGISCGLLGDCTVTGFSGKPACGETAAFITCKVVPLGCATDTTTTKTQGCK